MSSPILPCRWSAKAMDWLMSLRIESCSSRNMASLSVRRGWFRSSHAVALKDLAARPRQFGPVGLQAGLHRTVIAEVLAAEARGVPRTGLLLLRRTHMALCESGRVRQAAHGRQRDRRQEEQFAGPRALQM